MQTASASWPSYRNTQFLSTRQDEQQLSGHPSAIIAPPLLVAAHHAAARLQLVNSLRSFLHVKTANVANFLSIISEQRMKRLKCFTNTETQQLEASAGTVNLTKSSE